ncbi:hypothetical protein JTE90_022583 [Oedothorax gibbosus]|uniref:RING-type domain-containing protein n=1 Tax=Oedothorax gibbosus TaxID=931172 RepID=A0AAV6TR19_9ARAC|nr:hypothetical protein JTE90_022583 [Oedothorax gibbosus]
MDAHNNYLQKAIRICPSEEEYLSRASDILWVAEGSFPDIQVLEEAILIEPLLNRDEFPFRAFMSMLAYFPFEKEEFFDADRVETAARQYADRRFPVLAWIWEEYILVYIYNYLVELLPETRLSSESIYKLGNSLWNALMRHTWPNRYFQSPSTCPVCFEPTISLQVRLTTCRHVFCENCILKWLETRNTCPMCRAIIFWNF